MQRYFAIKMINDEVFLREQDIHHIFNVMRMTENSNIEVVYADVLYKCVINNERFKVVAKIEEYFSSLVYKILVIPVLIESKMSLVMQKATELGIDEIIPVITSRSIVKIKGKEEKRMLRWNNILRSASEQSKRIKVPILRDIIKLSSVVPNDGLNIVCSTKKDIPSLFRVLNNQISYDKITYVVGPEGGFSEDEEILLNEKGFASVSLGKNILRVETVPLYIGSVLSYLETDVEHE